MIGKSLEKALPTAGGTPDGIVIFSFSDLVNHRNSSVNIIPEIIPPISPLAPRKEIPPLTVSVPAKNAVNDTSPPITGVELFLDNDR